MIRKTHAMALLAVMAAAMSGCIADRPVAPAHSAAIASSPLIVHTVSEARPFIATDGRTHLVYELLLVNQSALTISLTQVEMRDAATNARLLELSGDRLAGSIRIALLGGAGQALRPSQSAFLFADVSVGADTPIPDAITHRFIVTQTVEQASGELGGIAVAVTAVDPKAAFDAGRVTVRNVSPVVLQSPVRGPNWIAFRGCCDLSTSHRGGTTAYAGLVQVTERLAIDFVRTDASGMLVTGPGNLPGSYPQYGADVFAVSEGTIMRADNNVSEGIPGQLDNTLSGDKAGGNAIVLKIADDQFAFYAHLQPGSVRVKIGDKVKAGDLLGKIGNSGKTIAPHLHFHISTRATPDGDGLPFVFASFTAQGMLSADPMTLAMEGKPVKPDATGVSGPRRGQLPLNNAVIDYGG